MYENITINKGELRGKSRFKPNKNRLKHLKTRRNYRKLQIRVSRIKSFLKLLMIIGLCWIFVFLARLPYWYLKPNTFTNYPNDSLIIEGNHILKSQNILTVLKTIEIKKQPIYLMDTNPIKDKLEKLAPVNKVYIRRFGFPARVKIVIEEKKPLFSIAPNPNVLPIAVFTKDSSLIENKYLPLPKNMDTYTVLTYADVTKWSSKHIKYLHHLVKSIENYTGENVKYIDMRNSNDIYVQLKTVKIRLGEFNNTLFKRMKRISSVLPQTVSLKDSIEYVDLRWDNSTFIKLKGKDKPKETGE